MGPASVFFFSFLSVKHSSSFWSRESHTVQRVNVTSDLPTVCSSHGNHWSPPTRSDVMVLLPPPGVVFCSETGTTLWWLHIEIPVGHRETLAVFSWLKHFIIFHDGIFRVTSLLNLSDTLSEGFNILVCKGILGVLKTEWLSDYCNCC